MGLREKLVNALGGQIVRSSRVSPNDFLRYGTKTETLYPTWSQVKMSDRDMYKGYSYAAIQRRANGVADIALNYIRTSVNDKTLESFTEQQETPVHPYLKLIQESTNFTEKEFWTTISIYLDLAGRYYLGCVRKQGRANSNLPSVLSDIKKFVLLNPYEVNRVINPNTGEVSGYIEHKPDGRERIWDNYQIIELRELNPFDWTQFYSVTDAAKENIFTLKQSGDYTAKSLDGNLKTPGIIATDIQLSPEEFADFRARIVNSREGEPIFANGGGHITWEPMNVDLDKSALSSVNEMNRTELFSAMGMSKTSMGIEESGTTRETARVQNENAATKTYKPRVDFIVGCLTKDYKQKYPREFKLTGYDMYVDSVIEADYDTEIKAVQLRQAQSDLANALIQQGYTPEVSAQYVQGEIELGDLVASEKNEVQSPVDEQSQPANPLEVSAQTPIEPLQGDSGSNMGDESSTEQSGLTGDASGQESENSIVVNNSITDELDLDNYNPADLDEKQSNELNEAYEKFLTNVRKVERQIINESSSQLIQNNFTESDFLDGEKKESFVDRLVNFYKQYWWIAFPLFANILTNKRNNEFGARHEFVVTNDIENTLDQTAKEVSEGHVNTIIKDVVLTANKVYDELTTNEAVKLIKQDYAEHPNNYVEYFVTTPTDKEILNAIRNTDILSQNERIYRTARQLALQGGSRQSIAKAIRERYQHISETRATTIARNETSRIFTQSQYDADFQFLNSIGKLSSAKKRLVSRTGHPCEICQAIINQGPIPFTQNFLDKGQSIEVGDKTFTANYEAIGSGVVHVNCNCRYELVFDNETFNALETKNLNSWVDAHSEDECCVCNASKGNPYHDVRDGKFTFAPFSSKAYSSAVKSAQNKMKKDYLAQAEKEGTTEGMSKDEINQMVDDEYSMYEPEDFPDADMMNSYIAREAGFNKDGATKLSREDFDKLDGQTYYRGVIAKSPADVDAQMKDWRLPDGEGGAGIYASTNRGDIESYVNPSDIPDGYKGYVIEMKIPANEQIHNYHEDNRTASDSYEGDFGRSQLDGSIALKHEVVSYGQDGAMTDAVCIKNKDIISYVVNEEENE